MLRTRKVSGTNRSMFDIIAEILRQLRIPTVRTNIMSHCNMNSTQSVEYLNFMTSNDLVRMGEIAGRVTYKRTEAGRDFLEVYNKMILLIDPSISAPSLM